MIQTPPIDFSVASAVRAIEPGLVNAFMSGGRLLTRMDLMAEAVTPLVDAVAVPLDTIGFHYLGEPEVTIDDHDAGRVVISFVRDIAPSLSGELHISLFLLKDFEEGAKLVGCQFSGAVVAGYSTSLPGDLLEFFQPDYRVVLDAVGGKVGAKCPCCCPMSELLLAIDFLFRDAHLRVLSGAGVPGEVAQVVAGFDTDHRALALKVAMLIEQFEKEVPAED